MSSNNQSGSRCALRHCEALGFEDNSACEGHIVGGEAAFAITFHDIPLMGQWGFLRSPQSFCAWQGCEQKHNAWWFVVTTNNAGRDYFCIGHAQEKWKAQQTVKAFKAGNPQPVIEGIPPLFTAKLREMKPGAMEELIVQVWQIMRDSPTNAPSNTARIYELLNPIFDPTPLEKVEYELKRERAERAVEKALLQQTISRLTEDLKRLQEKA